MKNISIVTLIAVITLILIPINILAEEPIATKGKLVIRSRIGLSVLGEDTISAKIPYLEYSWTEEVNGMFSAGGEFFYAIHENIELGVGAELHTKKFVDPYTERWYYYFPIFAAIRFPFNFKFIELYGIGRIGFGFSSYLVKGEDFGLEPATGSGLFYSVGAGVSIPAASFKLMNNVSYPFIEVNYSNNTAKGDLLNYPELPFEEVYKALTIYIGLETRL